MPIPLPLPLLDIKSARFTFFDRKEFTRQVKSFRREFGGFAGGLVRREARQSIRKAVKDRPRSRKQGGGYYTFYKEQPPDQPPRWRRGPNLGIRQIVYAWDNKTDSVVVGPMKYGTSASPVIAALEGTRPMKVTRTRRRNLRIGSGAVIKVGGTVGRRRRTTKVIGTDTPRGIETVTFIRLKTASQLARADRIQNELFEKEVSYKINPRPYMRPALQRIVGGEMVKGEKRTLATLWKKRQLKAFTRRKRRSRR